MNQVLRSFVQLLYQTLPHVAVLSDVLHDLSVKHPPAQVNCQVLDNCISEAADFAGDRNKPITKASFYGWAFMERAVANVAQQHLPFGELCGSISVTGFCG
jgi:hypothetical protein